MEQKVMVINRGSCSVGYSLPELSVNRTFRPLGNTGDRMMISVEELKALNYTKGGKILIDKYLLIEENTVQEELGITPEPEYFYSREEIIKLLKSGSEAQLLDCLDFAPEGVLDLIKREAIAMRLDSHKKREIISEKLNINLEAMIKNDIIVKTAEVNADAQVEDKPKSKRRAKPVSTK